MKNKVISIVLALLLLGGSAGSSFAIVSEVDIEERKNYESELNFTQIEEKHQEQIQAEVEMLMATENAGSNLQKVQAGYETVYGSSKSITLGGYAGNQPSGGTRFSTGGGFFYSTSGGPTASLSVRFGTIFGSIRVSSNIGKKTSSGNFVSVPNRSNYFKLVINKGYSCKPYVVYEIGSNGQRSVFAKGVSKIHTSTHAYAKKV